MSISGCVGPEGEVLYSHRAYDFAIAALINMIRLVCSKNPDGSYYLGCENAVIYAADAVSEAGYVLKHHTNDRWQDGKVYEYTKWESILFDEDKIDRNLFGL
jgi:hypothetical protein